MTFRVSGIPCFRDQNSLFWIFQTALNFIFLFGSNTPQLAAFVFFFCNGIRCSEFQYPAPWCGNFYFIKFRDSLIPRFCD